MRAFIISIFHFYVISIYRQHLQQIYSAKLPKSIYWCLHVQWCHGKPIQKVKQTKQHRPVTALHSCFYLYTVS